MRTLLLFLFCCISLVSNSQNVGIGTAIPNTNARLDITDSVRGLLIPRMDSTHRKSIPNTVGLMVYDSTTKSFWFNNGSIWSQIGVGSVGGVTHYVGELYGGGIVFMVDATGQHGLVAAPLDLMGGATIRWYAGSFLTSVSLADGPGAGRQNTLLIIAKQGIADSVIYAARGCNELSLTQNGITYADWYLPSKYELNLMYLNKAVIGGFGNLTYWSSTEYSLNTSTFAWTQFFGNGFQNFADKNFVYYIRAIRAF